MIVIQRHSLGPQCRSLIVHLLQLLWCFVISEAIHLSIGHIRHGVLVDCDQRGDREFVNITKVLHLYVVQSVQDMHGHGPGILYCDLSYKNEPRLT